MNLLLSSPELYLRTELRHFVLTYLNHASQRKEMLTLTRKLYYAQTEPFPRILGQGG